MKPSRKHAKRWLWMSAFFTGLVFLLFPAPSLAMTTYDLVIHDITPAPSADGGTDVRIFLSVWDEERKMVKNLEQGDFTITESGEEMEVKSLAQIRDEPISVALLLDVSGNAVRVSEEREAAVDFVKGLNRVDFVGVISFADEVKTEVELTDDHDKAQERTGRIKSIPEAGTCTYDAAYEAVKQVARQGGRRAIILITDSEDKAYQSIKSCSANTEEDVIESATDWNTRVPIYTVAVGEGADEKALERLANKTGGRYIFVQNSGDIKNALNDFSSLFQDEYILTYNTASEPGSYTLVVDVEHKSISDSDTRVMEITEGGKALPVQAQASQTPGEEPAAVQTAPSKAPVPTLPFEATLPVALPEGEESSLLNGVNPIMLVGFAALAAALIILLVVFAIARRTLANSMKKKGDGPSSKPAGPAPDATSDSFPVVGARNGAGSGAGSGAPIGSFTVLASDDAAMLGKVFTVNGGRTSIGRSSENDIVLAGDKAVSRDHVIVEQSGEHVFLAEVVSQNVDRSVRRPLYGTFVNEVKVEGVPVELHSGDDIRLGTRLRLRFESLIQSGGGGEATLDEVHLPSPDATVSDGGETVEYRP